MPATRSLGSAWPFRGRPRVPTRPGGPVSVQPPVRAQMVSSAQLPGSILELPPDVPAGGTSWGGLITRALGRKEERGVSTELAHSSSQEPGR